MQIILTQWIEAILFATVLGNLVATIHLSTPFQMALEALHMEEMKPFSCASCLAFWITIIAAIIWISPTMALCSGLAFISAKITTDKLYEI